MSYALWHTSYALWHMSYALWHTSYALWHMSYALWHMSYALCPISVCLLLATTGCYMLYTCNHAIMIIPSMVTTPRRNDCSDCRYLLSLPEHS
jgi:hypothetical protein